MGCRRVLTAGLGGAVLVALLAGCSQPSDSAAPVTSTSAVTLRATGSIPTVQNDLATNSAHHRLDVPGEPFGLLVDYWTDYPAAGWQTLQPKDINLSVHLVPTAPAGSAAPDVMIGSFTAVTTALAAMPGLDGLPIAQTQETSNALPGFVINENYPFDDRVTIEGFSTPLATRWAVVAGAQPLTEPGLVTAGVYGNRLTFSYRVLVRNNGDSGYHQRVVQDTLTVPESVQQKLDTAAPATTGTAAPATAAPAPATS